MFFPFDWLFGLGFWVVYVICGLFIGTIFFKYLDKKLYTFVKEGGKFKKDFDYEYDFYVIRSFFVALLYIFWPVVVCLAIVAGILIGLFYISKFSVNYAFKISFSKFVSLVQKIDKIVPDVSFKGKE